MFRKKGTPSPQKKAFSVAAADHAAQISHGQEIWSTHFHTSGSSQKPCTALHKQFCIQKLFRNHSCNFVFTPKYILQKSCCGLTKIIANTLVCMQIPLPQKIQFFTHNTFLLLLPDFLQKWFGYGFCNSAWDWKFINPCFKKPAS